MGEGNVWPVPSKVKIYGNILVAFYWQLSMGRKDTSFGVKYQRLFVGWYLLNYEEMFMETPIYIKVCCAHYRNFYIYACHLIILSYTTLLISWVFLCVLTYISPFTDLWHILDNVYGVQDVLAMFLC